MSEAISAVDQDALRQRSERLSEVIGLAEAIAAAKMEENPESELKAEPLIYPRLPHTPNNEEGN